MTVLGTRDVKVHAEGKHEKQKIIIYSLLIH